MTILFKLNKTFLPILNKRNPQSLKNCLDNFKKSWGDFEKLMQINDNWKELVGLELFKECKPLKIEKKILTITVNHPQWRQALIYNKHRLKERIEEMGISLYEIKMIQNYEKNLENLNLTNAKFIWNHHPSRINKNDMSICKFCHCPTPKGEISRLGKCTFCWRKKPN